MILYILFALTFTSLAISQQFRPDYEYNRKTHAFYKLHIETYKRLVAGKVCETEGAELMFPTSQMDIAQVHGMLKRYPDIGNYVWVKEDNMPHESVEEQSIIDMGSSDSEDTTQGAIARRLMSCDVVSRSGEVKHDFCLKSLPFVCKVEEKAVYFDRNCDVYGKNYQYNSSVGSCYRVSDMAYSWNAAYAECNAEGAHLVVLNSEAEQQAVWNIIKNAPEALESKESWFFFAGFRANKSTNDDSTRIFKTIFNQTLDQAGYVAWSEHEPNNANNNENCGSIFKNDGKLNDLNCAIPHSFICEKEIPLKSN